MSVRARSLSLFVPEMFRSRPLLIFLLLLKIRALSHTEVSERNLEMVAQQGETERKKKEKNRKKNNQRSPGAVPIPKVSTLFSLFWAGIRKNRNGNIFVSYSTSCFSVVDYFYYFYYLLFRCLFVFIFMQLNKRRRTNEYNLCAGQALRDRRTRYVIVRTWTRAGPDRFPQTHTHTHYTIGSEKLFRSGLSSRVLMVAAA